jgi:hypothetical protein
MKRFSAVLQFILGVAIGAGVLVGGAAAVGYVVFSRMATPPDKPIFAEEKQEETVATADAQPVAAKPTDPSTKPGAHPSDNAQKDTAKSQETGKPESKTDVASDKPSETQPEVKKEEKAAEEKKPELPTGAYKAKVTWSSGLSLRAEPSVSSDRVGGIDYNTELIILSTSSDGQWQRVKVANGDQEGWIKAGNVKKSE